MESVWRTSILEPQLNLYQSEIYNKTRFTSVATSNVTHSGKGLFQSSICLVLCKKLASRSLKREMGLWMRCMRNPETLFGYTKPVWEIRDSIDLQQPGAKMNNPSVRQAHIANIQCLRLFIKLRISDTLGLCHSQEGKLLPGSVARFKGRGAWAHDDTRQNSSVSSPLAVMMDEIHSRSFQGIVLTNNPDLFTNMSRNMMH